MSLRETGSTKITQLANKLKGLLTTHENKTGSSTQKGHVQAGGAPQGIGTTLQAGTDNGYYARADHVHTVEFDDVLNTPNALDVVDNLTTNDGSKPLSAKQGKWLNDNKAQLSHNHDTSYISNSTGSVTSNHIADGTIVNADIASNAAIAFSKLSISKANITGLGIPAQDTTYTAESTATNIKMNGTQSAGDSSTYARGNHVHPTDTSRAPTSHASTGTGYGVGTTANYGHNKIIDDATKSSLTNGESLSAHMGYILNNQDVEYVVSTHTSSTSTWTGICSKLRKLEAGTKIYYRLNQDPTTTDVTLNLTLADNTTTGAKNVYFGGTRLKNQYPKYAVIGMVFDGSNWIVINQYTNTNTTYSVATQSANGLMSSGDKTKLDGVATGANNYSHPSTHAATMITDANAHTNIGSSANANQGAINTAIDTALSNKQAKGSYAAASHSHSYLPLTGGTLTGNVIFPDANNSTNNTAAGNIPWAGTPTYNTDIWTTFKAKKSGFYTFTDGSKWWNLISVRHRNGSGDATNYGAYIKTSLQDDGNLIWAKQKGGNSFMAERTILDSSNYSTYAATSGHNHDGVYLKSYTPPTGSTSQAGIVKLNTATNSGSTTEAATPSAVKAAYDLANGKSTVSVSQTKTSGIEIGKITINGTSTSLYQQDNNTTYSAATSSANGLLTSTDFNAIADYKAGKTKVTEITASGSTVSPNANFNNYSTPGFYSCVANNTTKLMSNTPWGNQPTNGQAFALIVLKHAGVRQIVMPYGTSDPNIYIRNFYNNSWGGWYTVCHSGNLNNTVTSTSTTQAATANAVKTAYDKANHSHTSISALSGIATTDNDKIGSVTINGTEYSWYTPKLNDTISSTSTNQAATANAVRVAYNKANHSHPSIANNLTTSTTGSVLDATQGKWLKDNTVQTAGTGMTKSGNTLGVKNFALAFAAQTGKGVTVKTYTDGLSVYVTFEGTASVTAGSSSSPSSTTIVTLSNTAYAPIINTQVPARESAGGHRMKLNSNGVMQFLNDTSGTSFSIHGAFYYPLKSRLP